MIDKNIIQLVKFIFIITLHIYCNNNNDNIANNNQNNETNKQIGIDKIEKNCFLENNLELKKNFLKVDYILNEFIKDDNNCKLCFDFYKNITQKKITVDDFKDEIIKNQENIKTVLINNPIKFLEQIVESTKIDNNDLSLLKIKEIFQKIILHDKMHFSIENIPEGSTLLEHILKRKELEIEIRKRVTDYCQERKIDKKTTQKNIDLNIEYINKNPENEQQTKIKNINFTIINALQNGDPEPLKSMISEGIKQHIYQDENEKKIDSTNISKNNIEHLENTMNKITKKIDEMQNSIDSIKNNSVNKHLESKENKTDNMAINPTDNYSDEIKKIMDRITSLEKKNKIYFYALSTLAVTSLISLYKHFFSSDEN